MKRIGLFCWFLVAPLGCGGEQGTTELSQLRIEEISDNRAVVRFETSQPASGEVSFGTSDDELDQTATDIAMDLGELSFTHEVPLEDLKPDTKYYWRIEAVDRDDVVLRSDLDSFTTDEAESEPVPEADNVALLSAGAEVFEVSSNWGSGDDESVYGANQAFDGKMASEWASDGDGDEAWVELEFGGLRRITGWAFRSRHMADGTGNHPQGRARLRRRHRARPLRHTRPHRALRLPDRTPGGSVTGEDQGRRNQRRQHRSARDRVLRVRSSAPPR